MSSRYIAKSMYLELSKRLTVCDGGSNYIYLLFISYHWYLEHRPRDKTSLRPNEVTLIEKVYGNCSSDDKAQV